MEWLNYHHLLYFSVIARRGSIARAAEELAVSHSTLSAQLRALEEFLGAELFERRGRGLVLTPFGAEVASYAADIFRTGTELVDMARGRAPGHRGPLGVGVVSGLPKTVAHRLIEPALRLGGEAPLDVRQDHAPRLLEDLAAGRLHVVLSDAPPRAPTLRLHTQPLGETEVLLYAPRRLAARLDAFPGGLDGAPVLLPRVGALRRALDRWFADHQVRVRVAAEFDDAGLLRVFGLRGAGVFPVRAALRTEIDEAGGATCLGLLDGVRERYYAIGVERRFRHPGVLAIVEHARTALLPVAEAGEGAVTDSRQRRVGGSRAPRSSPRGGGSRRAR